MAPTLSGRRFIVSGLYFSIEPRLEPCISVWSRLGKRIVARMKRQRNAGTVIPDYASAPSGLQVRPLVIFLQLTS
jgi:hypothetical protein